MLWLILHNCQPGRLGDGRFPPFSALSVGDSPECALVRPSRPRGPGLGKPACEL